MEITIRKRLKNKDSSSSARPSVLVIIFLAAFFVFASINLVRDLGSQNGLRPFGFFEDIIAQITNQTPNIDVLISRASTLKVKDNSDRCVSINPATGRPYSNAAGRSSSVTGKAGINQGEVGDGIDGQVSFIQGENSLGQDLGMGFILSIFTNDNVNSAVNFITKANDAGLIPVVRLCFPGAGDAGCSFRMNNGSIPSFYERINSQLADGYEFVGLIGPNEPGTAGEMQAFGTSDYETLFNQVQDIANRLQNIRVINGGKMYMAPIAFNSNNTTNDDIAEFLMKRNLNAELFDYLLLNIYDANNLNSYELYQETREGFSFKDYAESNGLKVILSEFGLFDTAAKLDQFKLNFNSFCSDASIDGMLLFRSFEELGRPDGPNPDALDTRTIAELTQSCSRQRPWQVCNYDSAIYPEHPDKIDLVSTSFASANPSCIVREENNSRGAGLLVQCNGNDCSARQVSTIQAQLPIKQFGSNSSFGTKTRPFTPISAEVAAYLGDTAYDALNQFAGELKGNDGTRYAMPWLGSAINSASQLSLYLPDYARFVKIQSFPSPGSFSSNIKDEILGDIEKEINVSLNYKPASSYLINNQQISIPDEKIVRVNDVNIDKSDLNAVKDLRYYDPTKLSSSYKKLPNSCNGDMRFIQNSDDYIPGPEVIVDEKTIWSGSAGELCRLYGERNNGQKEVDLESNSNLNCRINPNRVIPVTRNGVTFQARCTSLFACNFQSGTCDIDAQYSPCIDYTPSPDDKVYVYSKQYASIPNFQIIDVWDALFREYQMLQDNLATRGLKIVFRENIGWRAEYQSFIRDANRGVSDPSPYLYSSSQAELDFDQLGVTGSAFQPKLFGNNFLFAKGKSSVRNEQYYDWLGYLDIIQEMRMIYLNSTELDAEQRINNPFFQKEGPNSTRPQINISGLASQFTTFPVLTCDQIEMCKQKDRLVSELGQETADRLCPFEQLDNSSRLTCITDVSDERFSDGLGTQLCIRGYTPNGIRCDRFQCIPESDNGIGSNFKLIYPIVNYTTVNPQGGYGCEFRRGDNGSECHTGLDFSVGQGTPIVAAADGEIIHAGQDTENRNGAYGLMVRIKHAGGVSTLYAHMSQVLVNVGDIVTAGQVIGQVGSTGNSTGPHLHFELRKNPTCKWDGAVGDLGRCTTDPLPYLTNTAPASPQNVDTVTDINLYPVGKDRIIPDCREPQTVVQVNTDLRQFNGPISLIPDAKNAFEQMMSAMRSENSTAYGSCGIRWGYRSAATQAGFGACGTNDTACACYSEHQLGTVVDFSLANADDVNGFQNTQCYNWLANNAHRFGFVQSYEPGNPDYIAEPWHWRWLPGNHAQEFRNKKSEFKYLKTYLESLGTFVNSPTEIPSTALVCDPSQIFEPGDTSFIGCSINIKDTGDEIDWVKASDYIRPYIRYYNPDGNNISWLGNTNIVNDASPETLADRTEVTNFVIERSKQLGLNPTFVITTWVEETWASAVGSHALGCGISNLPGIPYNQGKEAMIEHMRQQIDCLAGIVNKTSSFSEFMCTYSGEPAIDGTAQTCTGADLPFFGTIQPNGVRQCNRFICNPNFPVNICKYYNFF